MSKALFSGVKRHQSVVTSNSANLVPHVALAVLSLSLLFACAVPEPQPSARPAPAPAPAAVSPAPAPSPIAAPAPPAIINSAGADALREGVAAYQAADYRRAELRLQDALRQGLNISEQIQAHKTLAFTSCVLKRNKACEDAFQAAFDAARMNGQIFELTRAERGHPLWGPVYTRILLRQVAKP